jgi:hypothetical protein
MTQGPFDVEDFRRRVAQKDAERRARGGPEYDHEPFTRTWEKFGGKVDRTNLLDFMRELGRQHDLATERKHKVSR